MLNNIVHKISTQALLLIGKKCWKSERIHTKFGHFIEVAFKKSLKHETYVSTVDTTT
jgi:hypothetical protein